MQIRPEKIDQWLALADSSPNSQLRRLQVLPFARSSRGGEGAATPSSSASRASPTPRPALRHVKQPYVTKFFDTAPDLVATQPQIIYIDTPHDGFGPMGEIQPR